MKVKKIELVHLAPYLPYGLKIKGFPYPGYPTPDREHSVNGTITGLRNEWINVIFHDINGIDWDNETRVKFQDVQPYMRPLSKLTQEITHNGETFVPLIRLAAIAGTSSENCWYINKENRAQFNNSTATFHLAYGNSFIFRESEKWKDFGVPARQLELFQKLHEWHFDLYSLLESDLALELTNPLQTKQ